ncbi:MAG: signal peptidase I [Dysgonamonadaceae bacterium]|nr:signal peptidase I [Dysgonamonadaceae bacterium]
MKFKIKYSWRQFWKDLCWLAVVIVVAIVFAALMRIFLLCSFKVPSYSMHPAIEPGDFIMVNKQIPGPRIYRNIRNIAPSGKVETKRFRGIRPVKRNDIIVFNFPCTDWNRIEMNTEVNYVKRCVAIPGDTFMIDNGIYKITNAPEIEIGCRKYQERLSEQFLNSPNKIPPLMFPYDTVNYKWTKKDFGPFYIPKSGDEIPIDTVNYILYSKVITYETGLQMAVKNGEVCLGDSVIYNYAFAQNYYFMAGDYVLDSIDSRYWGLVPEDHIIGKAIMIWKSEDMDTKKIRWERLFKLL